MFYLQSDFLFIKILGLIICHQTQQLTTTLGGATRSSYQLIICH